MSLEYLILTFIALNGSRLWMNSARERRLSRVFSLMMVMMLVSGCRLVEMAFRAATGLILHLDGRVLNLVVMFKKVLDAIQKRIMIVWRYHLNMQCHKRLFSYQPDMNVVHVANFGNGSAQIAFQRLNVHRPRRAFQQFIDDSLSTAPRATQYQA